MFASLVGNDPIKAYLQKAFDQGTLPHALLFSGMDGVGKQLFAKALSAALLKTSLSRVASEKHPDFHSLTPEGKVGLHSIETLRSLIDESRSAPFEGDRKVFLIHEAERMQPAAANALLKTLEEPQLDTTLILLTSQIGEMLPTIVSRCIQLSFRPLSDAQIRSLLREKGHPEALASKAQGSIGKALHFGEIAAFQEPLFALLLAPPKPYALLDALEKIEALLEEEDPLQKNRKIEGFLETLFLWRRDQEIHREHLSPNFLFFPEIKAVSYPIPSIESIEKGLTAVRLALSRNIKLSVALLPLFMKILAQN